MKALLIAILLSAFAAQTVKAQALTPQGRLRKLSREIRGIDPDLAEYGTLSTALTAHAEEEFFAQKASEYLKSPEHVGKMVHRLDELFRFKASDLPPEISFASKAAQSQYFGSQSDLMKNSADYLFKEIAQNNEPWDRLLTAKDYTVFFKSQQYVLTSDDEFFRGIFSGLEDYVKKDPYFDQEVHGDLAPVKETGIPDDPRLAGSLTTARFLTRYTTTALNKNRRRAAAVFRIFLCDSMHPVVRESLDDINNLLDETFGKVQTHAAPVSEEQLHGTDPRCITCHEKLDPLGHAFGTSGTALMTIPEPGRVFFRRNDGTVVSIPGRGIGDLAQAITTLPEYSRCQVKHFWNWFMGTDVPINSKLINELVTVFDRVGRRPNDFIAYLVSRPEFYTRPQQATVSFAQVQDTLSRCTTCHMAVNHVPDFTKLPIGGSLENNKYWILKIINALDLLGDGSQRTMPKKDSQWQPSGQDLQSIKEWIWAGAPDDDGNPTLDGAFLKLLKGADQ